MPASAGFAVFGSRTMQYSWNQSATAIDSTETTAGTPLLYRPGEWVHT